MGLIVDAGVNDPSATLDVMVPAREDTVDDVPPLNEGTQTSDLSNMLLVKVGLYVEVWGVDGTVA